MVRRQKPILPGNNLSTTVNGLGTFLFIYCIPSGLLLLSVFYEFGNRDIWLSMPQPSPQPMSAIKAPMWPFMTKAFMELLIGVIASSWALGPRISTFWKNKFGQQYKHQPPIKITPSPYSTTSYQTVCPQNSLASSINKLPRHGRKYPPQVHRKVRAYKTSSQSMSLTGNETVL